MSTTKVSTPSSSEEFAKFRGSITQSIDTAADACIQQYTWTNVFYIIFEAVLFGLLIPIIIFVKGKVNIYPSAVWITLAVLTALIILLIILFIYFLVKKKSLKAILYLLGVLNIGILATTSYILTQAQTETQTESYKLIIVAITISAILMLLSFSLALGAKDISKIAGPFAEARKTYKLQPYLEDQTISKYIFGGDISGQSQDLQNRIRQARILAGTAGIASK